MMNINMMKCLLLEEKHVKIVTLIVTPSCTVESAWRRIFGLSHCFFCGLSRVGLIVGLDLEGLFQPKGFHDSEVSCLICSLKLTHLSTAQARPSYSGLPNWALIACVHQRLSQGCVHQMRSSTFALGPGAFAVTLLAHRCIYRPSQAWIISGLG